MSSLPGAENVTDMDAETGRAGLGQYGIDEVKPRIQDILSLTLHYQHTISDIQHSKQGYTDSM